MLRVLPDTPNSTSSTFRIVDFKEQTPVWWAWRCGGIGSSDAASILGLKPAKTAERLLEEKQRASGPTPRTFARQQGMALERAARAAYNQATGVTAAPVCVENVARPWQRASLDGLSPDGQRVVEIKCGRAALQRAAARGRPPAHHYAQLQHILSVTGLPVVSYWCFYPSCRPVHLEVPRDEAFIARLLVAEELFWQRLSPLRVES